jgi:hypothetical protein
MEAAHIIAVDPVLMEIASVSAPEGDHRYQMRLCRRHEKPMHKSTASRLVVETEHWLAVTAEIRQGATMSKV